ncbi:hypothetical protein ACFY3U_11425 [Micromonospora sp. NPDC000089]|uniref:hypothetical protein n=1 Tax=unclassified Micromonospora TaxID=2617518 RepID=UPI0036AF749D
MRRSDRHPTPFRSSRQDLIDDAGWKTTVGQWTAQMNEAIQEGLPAHQRVRFAPPPALALNNIQDTGLGGCPHPNSTGHDALARTLNGVFN